MRSAANPLDIYWIKHMKKLLILGMVLTTTACSGNKGDYLFRPSMFDHSMVTQRNITIEEKRFVEKKPASDVTYDYLLGLSDDYDHHGSSPVYIVMGYDPDKRNSKLSTTNKRSILKGQLAKLGMRDAVIKTIPIVGSDGDVVIGYDRMTAKGPENCGAMPGHQSETGSYDDYGMGCGVKSAMAKQLAYPRDLLGADIDMGTLDADRAANAVNRDIRSGEISAFVPSYVLSGLAGNTSE